MAVAAQSNTLLVNYSKIAADISSDPSNVKNYFQILEDTLIGFLLEPFHDSIRKRQRQSPKFYIFDCGVARVLSKLIDLPLAAQTYEYGRLFEAFIVNQIKASLEYSGK